MNNSKYGKIVAERGRFHDDEPVFLLRAQDVLAPIAVELYAGLVRGAASGVAMMDQVHADALYTVAEECENVAAAMRVWQDTADNVKLPD